MPTNGFAADLDGTAALHYVNDRLAVIMTPAEYLHESIRLTPRIGSPSDRALHRLVEYKQLAKAVAEQDGTSFKVIVDHQSVQGVFALTDADPTKPLRLSYVFNGVRRSASVHRDLDADDLARTPICVQVGAGLPGAEANRHEQVVRGLVAALRRRVPEWELAPIDVSGLPA